jgi:hypothetical protein
MMRVPSFFCLFIFISFVYNDFILLHCTRTAYTTSASYASPSRSDHRSSKKGKEKREALIGTSFGRRFLREWLRVSLNTLRYYFAITFLFPFYSICSSVPVISRGVFGSYCVLLSRLVILVIWYCDGSVLRPAARECTRAQSATRRGKRTRQGST